MLPGLSSYVLFSRGDSDTFDKQHISDQPIIRHIYYTTYDKKYLLFCSSLVQSLINGAICDFIKLSWHMRKRNMLKG